MTRLPKDIVYHTEYQEWINRALDRRGITLKLLADRIGADYSHLWRIARGDPAKYPNSARPGYEMNELIGRELGDLEHAMIAARYWKPTPDGVAQAALDLERAPDPDSLTIKAAGLRHLNDVEREAFTLAATGMAKAFMESLRLAERARGSGVTPTQARAYNNERQAVINALDDQME